MADRRPDAGGPSGRRPWPVLALIAAQLAVAAGVGALAQGVPSGLPVVGPVAVLFLVAFVGTEVFVLHLQMGRNAHSVSLAELTLVTGLFFLPVATLVLVRVVAGVFVLALVRRQAALKLAFNVSLWVVDVTVAGALFHLLGGALHGDLTHLITPATTAILAAVVLDSLAVSAVIAVSSGSLSVRRALGALQTCVAGGLLSAALAIVCVGALARSGWLAVPVVATLAAVGFAFRGYGPARTGCTVWCSSAAGPATPPRSVGPTGCCCTPWPPRRRDRSQPVGCWSGWTPSPATTR